MAATMNVRRSDKILFLGNSITAPPYRWFANPNGFTYLLDGAVGSTPSYPNSATRAGYQAAPAIGSYPAVTRPQYNRSPAYMENGFPGQDVTTFAANWTARCNAFNPDIVFWECNTNDEFHLEGGSITLQNVIDGYTSCFAQAFAFNPNMRLVVHSSFGLGEQWVMTGGVPTWVRNSTRSLAALHALIDPLPNVCLVDWNTLHLNWESTYQPQNGPDWVTMQIAFHPTELGEVLMGRFTMQYLTFS